MKYHADARTSSPQARVFVRPFCPKCHDMLLAPAVSQYVNESIVCHVWSCESCGHEFKTSVRLFRSRPSAPQPAAA